jgi:hypothetical protein
MMIQTLTKGDKRTLSVIAKQIRERGHKSELSKEMAGRYSKSIKPPSPEKKADDSPKPKIRFKNAH